MFTKLLKLGAEFNAHQRIIPGFILAYLLIWLVWHKQIVTSFLSTQGDLSARVTAAQLSLTDNKYIAVFIFSCLFYLARFGYYLLKNKTEALLEQEDLSSATASSEQTGVKNQDIERLMSVVKDLQLQLASHKEREKKIRSDNALTEKRSNDLGIQLEKVMAENLLLKKAVRLQKARLEALNNMKANELEASERRVS